jgi:hypothetical protein
MLGSCKYADMRSSFSLCSSVTDFLLHHWRIPAFWFLFVIYVVIFVWTKAMISRFASGLYFGIDCRMLVVYCLFDFSDCMQWQDPLFQIIDHFRVGIVDQYGKRGRYSCSIWKTTYHGNGMPLKLDAGFTSWNEAW